MVNFFLLNEEESDRTTTEKMNDKEEDHKGLDFLIFI
jgi:hypothetical protein